MSLNEYIFTCETLVKKKRETEASPKSINFALLMYKQLISEQRYTVFILLQHGMNKKNCRGYKSLSFYYFT